MDLNTIKLSTKLTVNELKEICSKVGIKYYGSKINCIARIKKKIETADEIESDFRTPVARSKVSDKDDIDGDFIVDVAEENTDEDTDGDEEEIDDDEYESVTIIQQDFVNTGNEEAELNLKKRKIAVKPIYLPFKKTTNRAEALDYLVSEDLWTITSKPQKKLSKKSVSYHEFYRCKVTSSCAVKICLVYFDEDKSVLIKKSQNVAHVHVQDKENEIWGMNKDTKIAIKHLYLMGTSIAIPIS